MFLINFAPSVGFGTSGVRALVSDLTPPVVATYVRVFIQHLRQTGQLQAATTHCVVGWDLRPSSPDIAAAVCAGLQQEGLLPDWAGCLPTPALALRALQTGCPNIMVTGSHIPFDRNGIKFYTAQGEILKADEAAMAVIPVASLAPVNGMVPRLAECIVQVKAQLGDSAALTAYTQRYTQLLPTQALQGLRIGVYQHSAVGRACWRNCWPNWVRKSFLWAAVTNLSPSTRKPSQLPTKSWPQPGAHSTSSTPWCLLTATATALGCVMSKAASCVATCWAHSRPCGLV